MSLTELHFGVLVAPDEDERARRTDRLAAVEAAFDPLPVTAEVSRAWGRLAAAVTRPGGNLRRRQIDLAIAATAEVEQCRDRQTQLGDGASEIHGAGSVCRPSRRTSKCRCGPVE
ncbi:hypothetical protein [Haloactinopolyspora alba]|uniref:hypothetical protein n=1 Tax=Haloactinopolyspora alba TaxID=648780 RepID=UPI003B84A6A0